VGVVGKVRKSSNVRLWAHLFLEWLKCSKIVCLLYPPKELTFAACPNGKVLVNLDCPSEKLGLPPDIHLALEFTSAEARSVARALLGKADEAEAPKRVASPFLEAPE
jgi:hypothetical protein